MRYDLELLGERVGEGVVARHYEFEAVGDGAAVFRAGMLTGQDFEVLLDYELCRSRDGRRWETVKPMGDAHEALFFEALQARGEVTLRVVGVEADEEEPAETEWPPGVSEAPGGRCRTPLPTGSNDVASVRQPRQARRDRFFSSGFEVPEADFWRKVEELARERRAWSLRKERVTRWRLTPKGEAAALAYRREQEAGR